MVVEMNEWNPEQYLQFQIERTQPAIDLVSRINIAE
jgi:trans-aconitate methyltransferase